MEGADDRIMSDYKTVDEFLAFKDLSQEEFELHKELIEECRRNELKIAEHSAITRENIEKMTGILDQVSEKMLALSVALQNIIGEAEDVSLRMLPDHKFFRE